MPGSRVHCSVSWPLSSKETHPRFRHFLRHAGSPFLGLGVSPRAHLPPPVWLGRIVGVALGFKSVPHSLRKERPHKPQIPASVRPLLAHTSLSNHPTFTSSVYTLADGLQVSESPLLPWTAAMASLERTESRADCLQC